MTNQKPVKFEKQDKYVVIKRDDLKLLSFGQARAFNEALEEITTGRALAGKDNNRYVVVNEDEPYAEQVWKLIEQSQTGKPVSPEAPEEGLVEVVKSVLVAMDDEEEACPPREDDCPAGNLDPDCKACWARYLLSKAAPLIEAKYKQRIADLEDENESLNLNQGQRMVGVEERVRKETAEEIKGYYCLACDKWDDKFSHVSCPTCPFRKYLGNKTEGEKE